MGSTTRTRLHDMNTPNDKLSTSDTLKQLVRRVCVCLCSCVGGLYSVFCNIIFLISLKGFTVLILVFALQRKNSSAFERNLVKKCCEKLCTGHKRSYKRTHTPYSLLMVPDVLSLSLGVSTSCTRVRVVLPIGSPGVYTVYRAQTAAIVPRTPPHGNITHLHSLLLLLLA